MNTTTTDDSATTRGAPTPWARVVRALRAEARARGIPPGEVHDLLGCRKQDLSRWSTEDGWGREPPLWVVRRLLGRLELVAVVLPDRVLLLPRSDVPDLDPG